MGIASRNKGHTHFKPPGQISLLRLVKPAQQAAPAMLARDADRSVNVAIEGVQWLAFECYPVVGIEHLGDDRRPGVELPAKGAKKSSEAVVDDGDHRAKVLGDLRGLLQGELRGQEPLFAFFVGKIRDVVGRLQLENGRVVFGYRPPENRFGEVSARL